MWFSTISVFLWNLEILKLNYSIKNKLSFIDFFCWDQQPLKMFSTWMNKIKYTLKQETIVLLKQFHYNENIWLLK